eukprot:Lithocolla_globosa_v1_NODE_286_length_4646_cov_126.764975.p1 type:complete len:450 gc:universal NODE_286_length_4646_cov_126.764975:2681-4030(+)
MSTITSPELDFQKVNVDHGTYQWSRVSPQTNFNTVGNGATPETVFECPPTVDNFGRSTLNFSAEPSGMNSPADNRLVWQHKNGLSFIQSISCYTRTGIFICQVDNCNRFVSTVGRKITRFSDMITRDRATNGVGYFEGLSKNNGVAGSESIRPRNVGLDSAIPEPSYLCVGALVNNGVEFVTPVFNVSIPLSEIAPHTILGMNKDIYFGQTILIRIVWAPPNQSYFIGSAVDNPETNYGAYSGNITIRDLHLMVAVEQNEVIIDSLRKKYESGELKFQIPYVYSIIHGVNGTDRHNVSIRLSRVHGSKLRRIYWAPFTTGALGRDYYRTNNTAGARILNFYVMLQNKRRTQYNLVEGSGDFWKESRASLKHSCILSRGEFEYNYNHVELFTGGLLVDTDSNLDDGLLLTEEQKIDFVAQTNAGATDYDHHFFIVTQKDLHITPQGVEVF